MLLAVLERRAGFKLATRDVFLNLAGGLRVTDPALDLAVIGAVLSRVWTSQLQKKCVLVPKWVFRGRSGR